MRCLLLLLLGAAVALAAPPLHTAGRFIVDSSGARVKLAAVNWYGAEEKDFVVAGLDIAPLASISHHIRTMGFNAVRLPWSNEMYESNPVVNVARLPANPDLKGLRALDVFDAVTAASRYSNRIPKWLKRAQKHSWGSSSSWASLPWSSSR